MHHWTGSIRGGGFSVDCAMSKRTAHLGSVVHDGAQVVGQSESVDLGVVPIGEVVLLAKKHVAQVDSNVAVPVGTGLLVPETQRVTDLVRDDADLKGLVIVLRSML